MKHFYSILSLLLFSNIIFSQTQIPIDSVSAYIGQHVKVCDKVADAFRPELEKAVFPILILEGSIQIINLQ